jgi:hypothetical protein
VGDLVALVETAGRHPPTCQQLREVLNMGRNGDKWAAFQRSLHEKVREGALGRSLRWLRLQLQAGCCCSA